MAILNELRFSTPAVSIIIPVFNQRPSYLIEAIDSVFRSMAEIQFEIIVCDDGSEIELSRLYEEACKERAVVFFRLHRNLGMNAARNFAALRAHGDYLLLLDSDDVLTGNWNHFIEAIRNRQPWIAFSDHCQYSQDLHVRLQERRKALYLDTFDRCYGSIYDPFLHSTFLFHPQVYRRDKFMAAGGFDCSYSSGDEIALQLRMLRGATKFDLLYYPGELYKYRKNVCSVVHDKSLYEALIGNIEKILEHEYLARHNIRVSVKWFGREELSGTAHYIVRDSTSGQQICPSWFDFKKMQFS